MDKLRKSGRICRLHYRQTLGNPRVYIVLFWFAISIGYYILSVKRISVLVDIKVAPWIFPCLLVQEGNQLFIILGALLLFCDAPFMNDGALWYVLRAGKKNWFWGNMIYIWTLSLVYAVVLAILPNLILFPRVTWINDWGQVLGALAQSDLPSQFGITSLDYSIMVQYTPFQAMGLSVVSVWVNAVVTGLLCYTFNLWVGKGTGALAGMIYGLTPYLIIRLSDYTAGYYLAPPAWMNLTMYNWEGYGTYPSPFYIFTVFFVLIMFLTLVSYVGNVKKDMMFWETI